jgi:hypothetical protein
MIDTDGRHIAMIAAGAISSILSFLGSSAVLWMARRKLDKVYNGQVSILGAYNASAMVFTIRSRHDIVHWNNSFLYRCGFACNSLVLGRGDFQLHAELVLFVSGGIWLERPDHCESLRTSSICACYARPADNIHSSLCHGISQPRPIPQDLLCRWVSRWVPR